MTSQSLLLLLLSFLLLNYASAIHGGEWTPIKNVNAPPVRDIGKYATEEHERRTSENLKFDRVMKGYVQLTKGINYLLIILAEEIGAAVKKYKVIVWDKPWEGLRNFTSFKPFKG